MGRLFKITCLLEIHADFVDNVLISILSNAHINFFRLLKDFKVDMYLNQTKENVGVVMKFASNNINEIKWLEN